MWLPAGERLWPGSQSWSVGGHLHWSVLGPMTLCGMAMAHPWSQHVAANISSHISSHLITINTNFTFRGGSWENQENTGFPSLPLPCLFFAIPLLHGGLKNLARSDQSVQLISFALLKIKILFSCHYLSQYWLQSINHCLLTSDWKTFCVFQQTLILRREIIHNCSSFSSSESFNGEKGTT